MKKITESSSNYEHLEKMSTQELLANINKEDQCVALAVEKEILSITSFIDACFERMKNGKKVIYLANLSAKPVSVSLPLNGQFKDIMNEKMMNRKKVKIEFILSRINRNKSPSSHISHIPTLRIIECH
mgnify:CR=1 FL=1